MPTAELAATDRLNLWVKTGIPRWRACALTPPSREPGKTPTVAPPQSSRSTTTLGQEHQGPYLFHLGRLVPGLESVTLHGGYLQPSGQGFCRMARLTARSSQHRRSQRYRLTAPTSPLDSRRTTGVMEEGRRLCFSANITFLIQRCTMARPESLLRPCRICKRTQERREMYAVCKSLAIHPKDF